MGSYVCKPLLEATSLWCIQLISRFPKAVASFTFISPVSSSIVAPAIERISKDLSIVNSVEQQMVFSVFVLGYAFGPLILGPLSEVYGRSIVLQLSNLFYLIFNTAGGWSRSKGEMFAFRFLSGKRCNQFRAVKSMLTGSLGLGGSAPQAVSRWLYTGKLQILMLPDWRWSSWWHLACRRKR